MAENPLLPHRKLRELHTLMLRCRELEQKQRARVGAREALLAATAIHLLPGDLLCSADAALEELAPAGTSAETTSYVAPTFGAKLPACAAMARGLQAAGDGLLLAHAAAGAQEPGWQAALTWAQAAKLPLLLACTDATGGATPRRNAKQPPLTWMNLVPFARRLKLPVLAVDGEDAVAVYRVMQESVIRARAGGGPAVIWAVITPPAKTLPRSKQPLARLESYLAVRKIRLSGRGKSA